MHYGTTLVSQCIWDSHIHLGLPEAEYSKFAIQVHDSSHSGVLGFSPWHTPTLTTMGRRQLQAVRSNTAAGNLRAGSQGRNCLLSLCLRLPSTGHS